MNRQHTAEPWTVGTWTHGQTAILGASGLVATLEAGYDQKRSADARRIAACVNACKDIPNEALESRVVGAMLEALRSVMTWASTPGDHGGNPYSKEFVRLAQEAIDKAEGR